MLAVTIHTVPTNLKKDKSSCEALSSHSPPHTARNRKHSFYLGRQGCPGIIMAIVGQRECTGGWGWSTSSATSSLPASSHFPLEWSPMSFTAQHPPTLRVVLSGRPSLAKWLLCPHRVRQMLSTISISGGGKQERRGAVIR